MSFTLRLGRPLARDVYFGFFSAPPPLPLNLSAVCPRPDPAASLWPRPNHRHVVKLRSACPAELRPSGAARAWRRLSRTPVSVWPQSFSELNLTQVLSLPETPPSPRLLSGPVVSFVCFNLLDAQDRGQSFRVSAECFCHIWCCPGKVSWH